MRTDCIQIRRIGEFRSLSVGGETQLSAGEFTRVFSSNVLSLGCFDFAIAFAVQDFVLPLSMFEPLLFHSDSGPERFAAMGAGRPFLQWSCVL